MYILEILCINKRRSHLFNTWRTRLSADPAFVLGPRTFVYRAGPCKAMENPDYVERVVLPLRMCVVLGETKRGRFVDLPSTKVLSRTFF